MRRQLSPCPTASTLTATRNGEPVAVTSFTKAG